MQLLLFISVLPSIILGWYIYKNDRLEKEPKSLLIKLLFGGVGSVILTLVISGFILAFFPMFESYEGLDTFELFIYAFIVVALVEEFSKWIFLKLITWKNKEFGHIYDAIVYAVFVSLGFATLENILYVLNGGLATGLMRAVLSVPGHAFFGVFMGYYYGIAKKHEIVNEKSKSLKHLFFSILIPVILHGIFDFCLMSGSIKLFIVYLLFVIGLYIYAFMTVKKVASVQTRLYTRFCTRCGTKAIAKFCPYCGNKIV